MTTGSTGMANGLLGWLFMTYTLGWPGIHGSAAGPDDRMEHTSRSQAEPTPIRWAPAAAERLDQHEHGCNRKQEHPPGR
jgi:hypothetical protein